MVQLFNGASAAHEKSRLVKRLRVADEPAATALATKLERCTKVARCRDAACPVCGCDFQDAAVALVDETIRELARARRNRMTAMTLLPEVGCVEPDELTVEVYRRVAQRVLAALTACGIGACIVSVEASFNEDLTGKIAPHWCVHVHIIALDWLSTTQKAELRRAFPPFAQAKRPTKFEPLDQNPSGRLYPFKPQRRRREVYWQDETPDRARHRATRKPPAATLAVGATGVGRA